MPWPLTWLHPLEVMARPQLDLELRGIAKRYGDFTAIDGVSLKVAKGQFVCLLGPSGCGKTTTLRCIAGLEEPDDGDILIGGKEATADPPWERDIAMMFQDFALFPHMTVARQVGFGLEMLKKPKARSPSAWPRSWRPSRSPALPTASPAASRAASASAWRWPAP